MILALFFGMTMPTVQPAPLFAATDYHMPGRDDIEPGTNALVTGGKDSIGGGPVAGTGQAAVNGGFFGEDGLTFADLLDVLNPLQHIPVIGGLYRALSGDGISAGARMAGGTLYGGPLGFLGALANTLVEEVSGRDIGGNALALFSGDGNVDNNVLVAGATSAHDDAQLASLVALPAPWDYGEQQANVPFAPELKLTPKGGAVPRTGPQLGPSAFHTLLSNLDAPPNVKIGPEGRLGLSAGGETPRAHRGTIREAGLEINRLLRPQAEPRN